MALPFLLVLCLPSELSAQVLFDEWTRSPTGAGSPDGAALGDVDGDGRLEIAYVLRSGDYSGQGVQGAGSLALFDADGALRWEVQTGEQLVGFPTMGDFDGDGFQEVAVCEVSDAGYCRVYDGDQTLLFSVGPLWFPAMTNGGAVAADINNDGVDDLIAMSSAGEVIAAYGPMGATAWQYDLYEQQGDWPFGHIAADDMDGDGALELAIGGAQLGGIYVLNSESGTEQWVDSGIYGRHDNYFFGSGPIFMNLDNDAALEVVAAMAGYPGPAAVIALDDDGSEMWHTPVPSDSLNYTSPAGADTDGDGRSEVFIQAFSGTIMKFASDTGALLMQKDLQASSWATPAFVDIDFDADMEIVTSTISATYLLTGNLVEINRYENANAGMFPPPVLGDTDGDGKLNMVTGAWYPQQLVSIALPYEGAFSWTAYGGSSQHGGSVPASEPDVILGDDPAVGLNYIHEALDAGIASTSGTQQQELQQAQTDVSRGFRNYLRGSPHTGLNNLRAAISDLQQAETAGYDTQQLQEFVAYMSIKILSQYIDRTVAVTGSNHGSVNTALSRLSKAQARYDVGNWYAAANEARRGGNTLRNFLDGGGYTVANHCPASVGEVYMAWVCKLNQVRDDVQALDVQYNDNRLTNASADLRSCIVWMPDLVLDRALPYCQDADDELDQVSATNVDQQRDDLSFAIMRAMRLYLDDVQVIFNEIDPAALVAAEGYYSNGVTAYLAGDYAGAIQGFRDAFDEAQPCSSTSGGLEGGGC